MNDIITHTISMDNGTSAKGIALFGPDNLVKYEKLPIRNELNFQKVEQHITRLDVPGFRKVLSDWKLPKDNTCVVIERPLINPTRFKASISAVRCLEATLIVLEESGFEITFIDSRVWQSVLLPDVIGSKDLKKASLELSKKLFPQFKIKGDGDPLLIGYYWTNKDKLKPVKLRKQL